MAKYRGRVDCFINPTNDSSGQFSSRMCGEMYTNIVQHLSQSGPELGIEMIAANYGIAGNGLDFWDNPTNAGHRTWAVFRFHSASMGKFDMMVFTATGSSVSYSPMNIATNANSNVSTTFGNVGISFACHPSGSNTGSQDGPWNGTYSLTSASIGASGSTVSAQNPVWKLNSQGRGAFFPRANGIGATFSASRNYMCDVIEDAGTQNPLFAHIIITEDSFTTLIDNTRNGDYKINHFGPYIPRSGSVPCHSPYVFFTNGSQGVVPWTLYTSLLGVFAGTRTGVDGCVACPELMSGSKFVGFMVPTVDVTISYNQFINSGSFERFPVHVIVSEGTDNGIIGVLKHLQYGLNMATNTVSNVSGTAAFGTTTVSTAKVLIPWSGSHPGFQTTIRTGRTMNFDT